MYASFKCWWFTHQNLGYLVFSSHAVSVLKFENKCLKISFPNFHVHPVMIFWAMMGNEAIIKGD